MAGFLSGKPVRVLGEEIIFKIKIVYLRIKPLMTCKIHLEFLRKKGENKSKLQENFELPRNSYNRGVVTIMKLENPQHTDMDMVAIIEKEMRYISAIIKQKGREILNNYTITPPQFVALQWLFEDGDMTIGDLSNKMYLACSTTTDLVDRMEKKALLMRVKDPNDRRVVRIHLLEEGKRIIDEVIKKRQAYLGEVLKNLSTEEILLLQSNLIKLHQEMRVE
jgi:MarR family transcriptional regulator, organic hydroperoxide resistance regulator